MNAIQIPSKPSFGIPIGDFVFKTLILLAIMLIGVLGIHAQNNAPDCNMSWETENNVTLSSARYFDCQTTIRPEDILTNPDACMGSKTVSVFSVDDPLTAIDVNPSMVGPQIDESYIGQRLRVIVQHDASPARAEAFITIEDKTSPELICNDAIVTCLDDARPISEGGSVPDVIYYDCSNVTIDYTDTFTPFDCTNALRVGMITRVWKVTDSAGNDPSECTQTIEVVRVNLGSGLFEGPEDKDVNCSDDLSERLPAQTGYPTLTIGDSLYTLIPGGLGSCSLDVSYSDITVPGTCQGTFVILRSWTVEDLCHLPTGGNNQLNFTQKINIVDEQGPSISNLTDITLGTSNGQCTAVVPFPAAIAEDNCGSATVTILTPFGFIDANGGVLHDVPVGVHDITYRATDGCGNISDSIIVLTILDDDAPNVVCTQSLVVPLSGGSAANSGGAQIFAASFDNGSADNCGILSYQVARMASACGSETEFGDYVDFSCCDLENNPVMVALKVTDSFGNYNICMVEVTVQDKIAPIITCPPNKALNCDDDYLNTDITGIPSISDNCTLDTFYFVDQSTSLNICGWGEVVRKWYAVDISGNVSECYQTITISNTDPFDGNTDITWPQDYTATDCGATIDPNDLPLLNARPILDVENCDNVDSYFTDQSIGDNNGSTCYSIHRTWTVIDQCVYDPNVIESPGIWTEVQMIHIDDTKDPIFIKGQEDEEVLIDGNCRNIEYTIMAEVDDCSPDLTFFYQIDLGNDGSLDSAGIAQMLTLDIFTDGTHKISWRVTDGCGNEAQASQLVTFKDTKAPSPIMEALFATLMPVDGGMVEINAKDFNKSSSDNCTPIGWLRYSYSVDINDTVRVFTCAEIGSNNVDIYVHDGENNSAFATTFVNIQDANDLCGAQNRTVTGMITTPEGDAIANVAVALEGSNMSSYMTGADGSYDLGSIPAGSFRLKPSKDEDVMNGVSTYDMVLMQRHILGLVEISDPYTLIAADVNNSGTISTSDMVDMRRLILSINDDFEDTPSWRFVVADHNFSSGGTFPEDYPINNPSDDMQVDFIGIKIGDINTNASTDLLGGGEQMGEPLAFAVQDQRLIAGETYAVSFNAQDFQDVIGFQYTLQFDADAIELGEINSGALEFNDQNFNLKDIDEGFVASNWYNPLPVSVEDSDVLFSVEITAKENMLLSEVMSIGSERTQAESYRQSDINATLVTGETRIAFIDLEIAAKGYELGQNVPNPFEEITAINIQVPSSIDGRLSIYDVTGKTIKAWNQNFGKGINEITLTASDLPEGGIYYYQFEADGFIATKKMVVIR